MKYKKENIEELIPHPISVKRFTRLPVFFWSTMLYVNICLVI